MLIQTTISEGRAREIARAYTLPLYEERGFIRPVDSAQANLKGRTHYVDDGTLRYHKARVLGAGPVMGSQGLLYAITESVAEDYENTSRGFRVVVFDLTGSTIRHDDDARATYKTRKRAEAATRAWLEGFDLTAHYRDALATHAARLEIEAYNLRVQYAALCEETGR